MSIHKASQQAKNTQLIILLPYQTRLTCGQIFEVLVFIWSHVSHPPVNVNLL